MLGWNCFYHTPQTSENKKLLASVPSQRIPSESHLRLHRENRMLCVSTRALNPPLTSRHAPGCFENAPPGNGGGDGGGGAGGGGAGGDGVGGALSSRRCSFASAVANRLSKSAKLRMAIGAQDRSDMAGAFCRSPASITSADCPHAQTFTPSTALRSASGNSHQLP